ncbi:MAG: lysophospholipid acyltransferase family protein [Candidatus Odinarchaeota archaeon]
MSKPHIEIKTKQLGYFLLRCTVPLLLRLFFRFRIEGSENVPRHGPCIVISNHLSHLDSFAIGIGAYFRTFHFMADSKMFKLPVLGKLIPKLNAFPIWKGSKDIAGIKYNVLLVKAGKATVYYPEGHRSRSGKLHPGKIGVGWLLRETEVPFTPCILLNIGKAMPSGKGLRLGGGPRKLELVIHFGQPVLLSKYFKMPKTKETAGMIRDEVMKVLESEQKRTVADYNRRLTRRSDRDK